MRFLPNPCPSCPFTHYGGGGLPTERRRAIIEAMLDHELYPCTESLEPGTAAAYLPIGDETLCRGAELLLHKSGMQTNGQAVAYALSITPEPTEDECDAVPFESLDDWADGCEFDRNEPRAG